MEKEKEQDKTSFGIKKVEEIEPPKLMSQRPLTSKESEIIN